MTCEFNAQITRMKSACFVDRIILLDVILRCLLCSATCRHFVLKYIRRWDNVGWLGQGNRFVVDLSAFTAIKMAWISVSWVAATTTMTTMEPIRPLWGYHQWHTLAKIMHSYQGCDNVNATLSLCVYVSHSPHIYLYMPDRFDFIIKSDYFKNLNIHTLQ